MTFESTLRAVRIEMIRQHSAGEWDTEKMVAIVDREFLGNKLSDKKKASDAHRRSVESRIRLRDSRCRLCGERKALRVTQLLPGPFTGNTAAVVCRSCHHDLTRVGSRFRVEATNNSLGCNGHLDVVAR